MDFNVLLSLLYGKSLCDQQKIIKDCISYLEDLEKNISSQIAEISKTNYYCNFCDTYFSKDGSQFIVVSHKGNTDCICLVNKPTYIKFEDQDYSDIFVVCPKCGKKNFSKFCERCRY